MMLTRLKVDGFKNLVGANVVLVCLQNFCGASKRLLIYETIRTPLAETQRDGSFIKVHDRPRSTLELTKTKLPKRSWAKISQIRVLAVERLGGRIARTHADELEHIIEGSNDIVDEP